MKLHSHKNQVFPMAVMKVLFAKSCLKLLNQMNLDVDDINVVLVKLSAMVLTTGYKPKIKKPMMNGVIKK